MPAGRPSKYKSDYTDMAETVCADLGATNPQLARLFGVGLTTLKRWMCQHDEFRAAIKRGKEQFDSQVVEQALLKRACGYHYRERTSRLMGEALELVKVVDKEVPPDATAIIFWLCNRLPQRWHRNVAVQHDMGSTLAEAIEQARERVKGVEKNRAIVAN